jgi:hypothetical protein
MEKSIMSAIADVYNLCPDLESYKLEFDFNTITGMPYYRGWFGFRGEFDAMHFAIDCDYYPLWNVTITEAYSGTEVSCVYDMNLTSAFRRAQLGAVMWNLELCLFDTEYSIFDTEDDF